MEFRGVNNSSITKEKKIFKRNIGYKYIVFYSGENEKGIFNAQSEFYHRQKLNGIKDLRFVQDFIKNKYNLKYININNFKIIFRNTIK